MCRGGSVGRPAYPSGIGVCAASFGGAAEAEADVVALAGGGVGAEQRGLQGERAAEPVAAAQAARWAGRTVQIVPLPDVAVLIEGAVVARAGGEGADVGQVVLVGLLRGVARDRERAAGKVVGLILRAADGVAG